MTKAKNEIPAGSENDTVLDDVLKELGIAHGDKKQAPLPKQEKPTPKPEPQQVQKAKKREPLPAEEEIPAPKPLAKKQDDQSKEDIHSGHRSRVRKKFLDTMSFDGFADHEILEMLLFYALPRSNTNEISHMLIRRFGSFSGVLNAPYADLCESAGINEHSALFLKVVMKICAKYHVDMQQKLDISNTESLEDYMIYQFSGEREECSKLICVDDHGKLYAPREVGRGLERKSVIDFKKAMSFILETDARSIILAHNHINEKATPTENDVVMTRRFKQMLEPIGVKLIDHFVVKENTVSSMRALGLLDI